MKPTMILFLLLGALVTACAAPARNGAETLPGGAPAATIDPFVAVEQAQRTALAAQDEAEFYSRQLTATAQAPIVAITATAAAWQMQQQYAQATTIAQQATETAAITSTAMAWTPTPNATATMVMAQTIAMQTQVANDSEIARLEVVRAQRTNNALAWLPYLIAGLAMALAYRAGRAMITRLAVVEMTVDPRGNPAPMVNVVEGRVIDALPVRMQLTGPARQAAGNLAREAQPIATDIPLPTWDAFMQWDGGARPLGMGREGLITTRTASPHVLISGKTGSGKTLYGLRTMVTASLSRGVYVVNVGFSDSGFGVFSAHPNYKAIKFNSSADIIPFLQAVYGELRARVDSIGGQSADWEHWQGTPPAPFVDIVIDELGNMAEDIYVSEGADASKRLWRWVSMIANEGRKVGIRFLAALQDPTAKSVDLRFRRNCTLVAFQQGDASQSSAFLGTTGAEALPVGRFMARVDSVTVGGGFAPTDAQITDYLIRHEARQVDAPQWLSANSVTDKRIGTDGNPPLTLRQAQGDVVPAEISEPIDDIARLAEGIRGQWFLGMSKSAVSRLLGYPQYGGSYKSKTDAVVEYLHSTTTDQKGAEMPVLGLVGA